MSSANPSFAVVATVALVVVIGTPHDVTATNTSSAYFRLRREVRGREALKEQVPPGGGTSAVSVGLEFIPLDVLDVDDVRQVISLSAAINLQWKDPALAWDSAVYEGIEIIHLPSDEVWKPLVLLVNGASDSRVVNTANVCRVSFKGEVIASASDLLHFTCAMDHSNYPFDTQNCHLTLALFSSVNLTSRFAIDPMAIREAVGSVYITTGEWEVLNVSSVKENEIVGEILTVFYVISLKRKTAFYVSSFIIPVVMTSYMNTLVFVMSTDSEERVSYLVSIFVSNAVFVGFCTSQMPQGMKSIPLVMYLLLGIMAESGLLVIVVSILARAAYLRRRGNDVSPDVNTVPPLKNTDATKHRNKKYSSSCSGDLLCFLISIILNTIFVGSILWTMTGN